MKSVAAFQEIPVVDLSLRRGSSRQRAELADKMREICHQVGFLVITDHGVSETLVETVFDLSRRLFDLPLEQKLLIDKRESRHFRGWEPVGSEYTNNRPDYREQVDLWSEYAARDVAVEPSYLRLLGPNQWFPEDVLPGFRETMNRWFVEVGALADDLMALLARGLALPEDHFEAMFGSERMSLTKLIHYPATPADGFGVNAHHDAGILTVLAPGGTPGLQVENAAGEWISVPTLPGALVINLGEVFQSLTGNYFVATPHRVVTEAERYAVGYFHGPSLDTRLDPLELEQRFRDAVAASPRHRSAGFMAQRDEIEVGVGDMQSPHHPGAYGEQLWNYFARSYPDNVRRHYSES